MSTPVLDLRDVGKAYFGTPVLAGVTFTIERGEVVALTGPNGSGKSTLLRCIIGRELPDTGSILFEGKPYRMRFPSFARLSRPGWNRATSSPT